MRAALLASSTGTMTAVPRMRGGCPSRIASSVLFAIASMKPAPSVFVEMRNVRMSSSKCTRSTISGMRRARLDQRAAERFEELRRPSVRPVRCSATWLAPPVTTFWWHSLQLCAL